MKRLLGLFVAILTIPAFSAGGDDPKDDPAKWEPVKIAGRQRAPEFEDIKDWINSKPLTMKELRGKVVVVNFMAFGCINCVRNYPWYKGICKGFKDKDLVMIGIHTPETEAEKSVKNVEKAMKKAELKFPIAIDNKTTMWQRYYNRYWPSVYLIDKAGIARWGWSGELGWKGAKGTEHMRTKIEELLTE